MRIPCWWQAGHRVRFHWGHGDRSASKLPTRTRTPSRGRDLADASIRAEARGRTAGIRTDAIAHLRIVPGPAIPLSRHVALHRQRSTPRLAPPAAGRGMTEAVPPPVPRLRGAARPWRALRKSSHRSRRNRWGSHAAVLQIWTQLAPACGMTDNNPTDTPPLSC